MQKVILSGLLILARGCGMTTPGDFWLQCEGIVQDLDDRRQEVPPGVASYSDALYTYQMYEKESWVEEEQVVQLRQSSAAKILKIPLSTKKAYSQEQHGLEWKEDVVVRSVPPICPPENYVLKESESPANIDRTSSWKKLPSEEQNDTKHDLQICITWGYWGEPPLVSEESSIMCRICEEEVPTSHVEDHSRICTLADKSDQKGLSVDERLMAIAVNS
ncbi:putative serine/threonine protein kinase IREH1 [Raphanus sativus]|nr:putative serine/threonine protein kinase IREH1 [Raphanus sativus]